MSNRRVLVARTDGLFALDVESRVWYRARASRDEPALDYGVVEPNGSVSPAVWGGNGPLIEGPAGPERLPRTMECLASPAAPASGLIVVTDSHKRDLVVYDTRKNKELAVLTGHREQAIGAAFNPADETRLASVGGDRTLRIWDWNRQALLLERPILEQPGGLASDVQFRSIAWSRDGTTIATGSTDGTIHLWRAPGVTTRAGPPTPRAMTANPRN